MNQRLTAFFYHLGRVTVAIGWIFGVPSLVWTIAKVWSPWGVLGFISGIWIYLTYADIRQYFIVFNRYPVKNEFRWRPKTVIKVFRDKHYHNDVRIIIRLPYWKYIRDWRFH